MNQPVPPDPDDQTDRLLRDGLRDDVDDVVAGPELLERIRADLPTHDVVVAPAADRSPMRWLIPAVAAAVVVLVAGIYISRDDDSTETIADGGTVPAPSESGVVLEGTAGGEMWSVVEYLEDDPNVVDQPDTCLRIEPQVERGPFYCESFGLIGAHGRLTFRSDPFRGHRVFAGVFAPEVAQLRVTIDGETQLVEPTVWDGGGLGVAVVMQETGEEATWNVDLLDADGAVLSQGGGDLADAPGD